MFTFARPTASETNRLIEEHSHLRLSAALLDPRSGLNVPKLPQGFVHDLSRTEIGKGRKVFEAAALAFQEWKQFDLGWVRVGNPAAHIETGQIVAVEVQALGLWSLNLSQIVCVTNDSHAFGFIYKTTPHHAEQGEERFLLNIDPQSEQVSYELEAVSKPQNWLAALGYPITRIFQHRFARDSRERMKEVAQR